MKNTIVMTLFVLFTSVTAISQTSDENAIKKVITAFSKAGDNNDVNTLDLYLDTNYRVVMNRLFGSQEVNVIPRSVYLEKIKSKEWGGDTRKITIENILINNSVASAKVTFKGTKMTFVSIMNLVKDAKGEWKLICDTPIVT